ncbi:MAG TPA: ABC transporter permease [Geminicoccaceae bacterium]|nr:ABC transporter permease [Geminicoccaceae bacterium]
MSTPPSSPGVRAALLHAFSVWNLLILLVLLVALFAVLKPDTFLTAFTFRSMANSRSINALLALAVMIPLAANQFDLSVASVLGIAQVLANGLQTQQHLPWQLAVLLVLALGAVVGLINGLLVTRARINSFIATLGTGTVLLGLNQWYTGGRQVVGALPAEFTAISSMVPGLGVPAPLLYVLVVGLVLWVVFDYLPLGRYLYVIGDSPRAAQLSGVPTERYVTLAFVASGTLAALAGIMLQVQLQVGQSTVGQELMLPAFTGGLLGATAIRPGRPNVWGTVLAVAVLAVAVAGLSQLGAPFYVEPLFNGGMPVLAVGLAAATQRRRESRAAAAEAAARAAPAVPRPATTS